ncbi:thioredoxin TrxC [Chthonobacter rhizosphaerae]|uniref:thioredoxin TrxC n=1 Tax=Chthonobacter rhizosphaerae TaxID=2735553 RepID=UPI0015EEFFF5|nr:thioredoxin TrxC [Chthonobacter rhizosphaerae]
MAIHVVCPSCGAVNRVPDERLRAESHAARCPKCAAPLFPGSPADVTGETLRRHVERSDLPVVVDCWAAWCGPCRMMAPAFAEAAGRLPATARFLKLDTDSEQSAAAALGIRSIPTLILFNKGREVARQAGVMTAAQIERWVTAHAA